MPIRAVFFDLGETLLDESRMWRGWADWLSVPADDFMRALEQTIARGEHHRRVFDRLRPGFDVANARRERDARGMTYAFEPRDLYPDAIPCMRRLRDLGYFVAVAGNQPRDMLDSMLMLGLDADLITTSGHLGHDKPSPDFFHALLSQAGFRGGEAAYVGDRIDNDVLPAAAAGMLTVFVQRGPWGRIHADRSDAAALRVSSLAEIPAALEHGRRAIADAVDEKNSNRSGDG